MEDLLILSKNHDRGLTSERYLKHIAVESNNKNENSSVALIHYKKVALFVSLRA